MKLPRLGFYGAHTLLVAVLHSLFITFYVDSFVRNGVRVSDGKDDNASREESDPLAAAPAPSLNHLLFAVLALAVYAVWSGLVDAGVGSGSPSWLASAARRRLLRPPVIGPLWAASFGLLWMQWSVPALSSAARFVALMALYNSLLSHCVAAAGNPLTDPSLRPAEKDRCAVRMAAWSAAGSCSVLIGSSLYDHAVTPSGGVGLAAFGAFCVACGLLVGCGLYVVGMATEDSGAAAGGLCARGSAAIAAGTPSRDRLSSFVTAHGARRGELQGTDQSVFELYTTSAVQRFWTFAVQTFGRESMKAATIVAAVQGYSSSLAASFFGLFLCVVCQATLSPSVRAFVILMAFLLPQALAIFTVPLYATVGKKNLLSLFCVLLAIVGAIIVGLGVQLICASDGAVASPTGLRMSAAPEAAPPAGNVHSTARFVLCLLLLANRVLTDAAGGVQRAALCDVIDEDTVIFGRQRPMSAAIAHVVACAAKPSETAALAVGLAFLYVANISLRSDAAGDGVASTAQTGLVVLFVGGNALLSAVVMLAVWHRRYNLDGKHLQFIQMAMRKRTEDEEVEEV